MLAYSVSDRCRCKNQFCFSCLTAWKSGPCDIWNEDRLIERAENIIDRDEVQAPMPGQARHHQIQEVARDLRANYACAHNHIWWTLIERPWQRCENCRDELEDYVFECPDCRLRVCRWCSEGYVSMVIKSCKIPTDLAAQRRSTTLSTPS